jgi:hypothetical protein
VRFGWNRHGHGKLADERHRRLRAHRVILPGSVLVLKIRLSDLPAKLLQGLGQGREQGYGCLLPHPGIASSLYQPHERQEPRSIKSRDLAGIEGPKLFELARGAKGPSPSQIGAVAERIPRGDALEYLKRQMERGSVKHWHRWKEVVEPLSELIGNDPELAHRALRVWQDLAIIHAPERERS